MRKPSKMFIVRVISGVVLLGGIGASSVAGFYFGTKNNKADSKEEVVSGKLRKVIEIVETEDGKILLGENDMAEYGEPLGVGSSFMDNIPVDCDGTLAGMRKLTVGKTVVGELANEEMYQFQLLNLLAKDVCSYGEYRNYLAGDLGKFLFTNQDLADELEEDISKNPSTQTTTPASTETPATTSGGNK